MRQTARQIRGSRPPANVHPLRAMDWRKFSFEYRINDPVTLSKFLISIEAYKEAATSLLLPPDWRAQLDKLNRARSVYGTTMLEGNPLSEAEVSQQVDIAENPNEAAKRKATREQQQIRNAARAQAWVRERFTPDHAPIAVRDILYIHKLITDGSDETHNVPGAFRTFPVVVGSPELGGVHNGAPYNRVSKLMEEYAEFANSRPLINSHPVIRALLAHFYLATIHPFGDGNGRVSRLVEAGILYHGGYNVLGFYGLSNYFYRNEVSYKTILQQCRRAQPFDVTPFITFGLEGFCQELKGINNFIKTKLNRVVYRDTLLKAYNQKTSERRRTLNLREYNLLGFLLYSMEPVDPFSDNPSKQITYVELRRTPYVSEVYKNVTARTFYRELQRLADLHFIKFIRSGNQEELIVELDFQAIGHY